MEEVDKERYTDRTRRRKKYQRARWFGKLLETKKLEAKIRCSSARALCPSSN